MEHPESMYLQTLTNQIHWSFVLDSSFNFGSMTLQSIYPLVVPLVHLSKEVLIPEVVADIIEMELKSLSSK